MSRIGKIAPLRLLSLVCLLAGITLLVLDWQRFLLPTLAFMLVAIISSILEIKRVLLSSLEQEHREALHMLRNKLPNHTAPPRAASENNET